jgi:hypothetical protein
MCNITLALPCRKTRVAAQKGVEAAEKVEEGLKGWDPAKDEGIEGDPFKTLFVGRISYEVDEKKLRREFEEFGPVKRIRLVTDEKSGTLSALPPLRPTSACSRARQGNRRRST